MIIVVFIFLVRFGFGLFVCYFIKVLLSLCFWCLVLCVWFVIIGVGLFFFYFFKGW